MSIFKKPFESFRIKYTSVFKFGINFVSPAPAQPEEVRFFVAFTRIALSLSSEELLYVLLFVSLAPDEDFYGDNFYVSFTCDKLHLVTFL